MLFGLFTTACGAQAPAGKLTYCSYSNAGAAGLGKDYCELIADIGQTPKVVVALNLDNRFGTPEIHAEYPVDQAVVDSLQAKLADRPVEPEIERIASAVSREQLYTILQITNETVQYIAGNINGNLLLSYFSAMLIAGKTEG